MKRFHYRALTDRGREVSGELEATGKSDAARKLHQRDLRPFEFREVNPSGRVSLKHRLIRFLRLPMNRRRRLLFTRQLATLLEAGMPLLRSVRTLRQQFRSSATGELLGDVERDLRDGSSLSEALGRHPRVFGRVYVQVVKAGETAGALGTVLTRLADFERRRENIRTRVIYAALYPSSVLVFSLVIALFLVVWVLPVFARMYRGMDVALPLPTRILLRIRLLVHQYGPWLLVALAAAAGALAWVARSDSDWGRRLDSLRLSIPVLGRLYRMSLTVRFARTLGTLLESGVPILEALETVEETLGNERARTVLKQVRHRVSEGGSLSRQIEETALFSPVVVQMISVGEQTGRIGEMLSRIADVFEFRVESSVEGLSSVLQPVLLVLMGLLVGACVLSMFLPMLNLVNVIGIR